MENITVRVRSYSNLHCPLETSSDPATKCKVCSGYISVLELAKLSDGKNVRAFLDKETPVSQKIKGSFRDGGDPKYPEKFSVLNGGITIFAKKMVGDPTKVHPAGWDLTLEDPNVINGAQTRGLLMSLLEKEKDEKVLEKVRGSFVRYELLLSEDDELVDDVSITRNSQTEVQFISILNKNGILDDLEASIRRYSSANYAKEWSIRKKETDPGVSTPPWKLKDGEDYHIDTERLVQILIAMTPDSILSGLKGRKGLPAPQHSTRLMQALRDFEAAKEKDYLKPLYDFYVQFAPQAWMLWHEWCYYDMDDAKADRPGNWWKTSLYTSHEDIPDTAEPEGGAKKKRLQKHRIEGATIVPKAGKLPRSGPLENGLGFPVLSALSEFCVQERGRWIWSCPSWFDKREKIRFMKQCAINASGKVNDFGHRKDAYEKIKGMLKDLVMARTSQEKDVALQEKEEKIKQLERQLASLKKKN